ncbi:prolyl oligopeptidase family serine peptidase [Paenibacillus sp. GCM10027626]|uniref:alpha/beta hydrolase family protein n=1 Tax=Paenibacillus sp. GCM10027626 TaxID=3273411 RepID=UPI00362B1511
MSNKRVKKSIIVLSAAAMLMGSLQTAIHVPALGPPTVAAASSVQERQQLSLRELCDMFGFRLVWNATNRTVSIHSDDRTLSIQLLPDPVAKTGNSTWKIAAGDVAVKDNRIFVAPQILEKGLDIKVGYSGKTKELEWDMADIRLTAGAFWYFLSRQELSAMKRYMADSIRTVPVPASVRQMAEFLPQLKLTKVRTHDNGLYKVITFIYDAGQMSLAAEVRFDRTNRIKDYIITADSTGYIAPGYDKPDRYTEESIVVGEGEDATPGTLTLPRGEGPFPVVVLVQGDGELDRDSAVMAQKPFRDLAVGLADRGIATIRYDKKTRTRYAKLYATHNLTKEFIEGAIEAVEQAKKDKRLDGSRIFVAGHSRGGWMMPAILEQDKERTIAGALIMGSPNPSISEADTYYDKSAESAFFTKEQIAYYREQIKLVKAKNFDPAKPPAEFQLPPNPYWWQEATTYVPVKNGSGHPAPLFVMQGEEDFHVKASELETWRKVYGKRPGSEFKLYPKLTHMFTESTGKNTTEEYYNPASVSEQVITDIAAWVEKTGNPEQQK